MEQTDRNRRVRAVWRGLALVAFAAAAMYAVRPRQRLLTQVARPVLKRQNDREKYFWLSPDRLLLVTTLWKRDDGYDPNGVSLHPNWRGWADLLDTTTHTRTRLKPLTDLLNRTGVQTDSFAVDSPVGGLYWESANGQNRTCAALLDGTHSREWTHDTVKQEFYLDSHHFVQIALRDSRVTVYDLLKPSQDQVYAQLDEAQAVFAQFAARHPAATVVIPSGPTVPKGFAEIDTYSLRENIPFLFSDDYHVQPVRCLKVKLPSEATLAQGLTSSQQQSIVYNMVSSPSQPLLAWLYRFVPELKSEPTRTQSLWVSRADGRGMHEIGQVALNGMSDDNHQDHFIELRWLPDGKHVSFIYRDTLYVTPAEPEM